MVGVARCRLLGLSTTSVTRVHVDQAGAQRSTALPASSGTPVRPPRATPKRQKRHPPVCALTPPSLEHMLVSPPLPVMFTVEGGFEPIALQLRRWEEGGGREVQAGSAAATAASVENTEEAGGPGAGDAGAGLCAEIRGARPFPHRGANDQDIQLLTEELRRKQQRAVLRIVLYDI